MSAAPLHPACTRAPGSLMLMGEHAVLHGCNALCAAIDQEIRVRLQPAADRRVRIDSALGTWEGRLDQLQPAEPFQFVLAALGCAGLTQGLHLEIEADFAATIGFGSSAAVTVATVAALQAARGLPLDRAAVFSEARAILHQVQGRGSGADLAAATYGGVVRYRAEPLEIEPLRCALPLAAHYCGYKTPTAEVIARLDAHWAGRERGRDAIFAEIDGLTREGVAALRAGDLPRLGGLFDTHARCQEALGCADDTLNHLLRCLRAHPAVLGAKISGSGLGDCVISLAETLPEVPDFTGYALQVDLQGVQRLEAGD